MIMDEIKVNVKEGSMVKVKVMVLVLVIVKVWVMTVNSFQLGNLVRVNLNQKSKFEIL